MKIRHGFVSNSSTTSFVIIGYAAEECATDLFKKIYPKEYDEVMNGDFKYPEDEIYDRFQQKNRKVNFITDGYSGNVFYGKIISKWSSDLNDADDVVLSIDDVVRYAKEVKELSNNDTQPQIMVVTVAS